eukprot:1545866-Pleurochrysis_carterae.AAC.4
MRVAVCDRLQACPMRLTLVPQGEAVSIVKLRLLAGRDLQRAERVCRSALPEQRVSLNIFCRYSGMHALALRGTALFREMLPSFA